MVSIIFDEVTIVLTEVPGHPEGDKANLDDILEAIEDDEELRNLTKDDSDALLEELVAWRELNKGGVRLNNKASTQDASCTFDRTGREVRTFFLSEC
jgi:hypothetical protein